MQDHFLESALVPCPERRRGGVEPRLLPNNLSHLPVKISGDGSFVTIAKGKPEQGFPRKEFVYRLHDVMKTHSFCKRHLCTLQNISPIEILPLFARRKPREKESRHSRQRTAGHKKRESIAGERNSLAATTKRIFHVESFRITISCFNTMYGVMGQG